MHLHVITLHGSQRLGRPSRHLTLDQKSSAAAKSGPRCTKCRFSLSLSHSLYTPWYDIAWSLIWSQISLDLTWTQVTWSASNHHIASYDLTFPHYKKVARDNIMVTLYDWTVSRVNIYICCLDKGAGKVAQDTSWSPIISYISFAQITKWLSRKKSWLGHLLFHLMRLFAVPVSWLHSPVYNEDKLHLWNEHDDNRHYD